MEPILFNAIEEVLKPVSYDEDLVQQWVNTICEKCMKSLADLQKPYKYIVTCQIMQKTGAGIHTALSCYWNPQDDNLAQVVWPNENKKGMRDTNNSRMYCIITAVGMSI